MTAFFDLNNSQAGTPWHQSGGPIVPVAGENILYTTTLPTANVLQLTSLIVSSYNPGKIQLLVDNVQIAAFRLESSTVNFAYPFYPNREVNGDEVLTLKFFAETQPIQSDVDWSIGGFMT